MSDEKLQRVRVHQATKNGAHGAPLLSWLQSITCGKTVPGCRGADWHELHHL